MVLEIVIITRDNVVILHKEVLLKNNKKHEYVHKQYLPEMKVDT